MSKQIGIKEVLNLSIFDFTTNDALITADYAMDTSVDSKASRLDLSGGQGNYKLLSFDHTKTMDFKCTLPLVDLTLLSELAGKPLTTATALVIPKREILTASATNTITLSQGATIATGTLQVYLLSGTRDLGVVQTLGTPTSTPNCYSITTGVITLNATTAPVGTQFIVFYEYSSDTSATQITFTANNFPNYMRIVGEGLVTDQITGALVPTLFEIKKCKVQSNFSITMNSTKATEMVLTFDMYSVDITNLQGTVDKVYSLFTQLT